MSEQKNYIDERGNYHNVENLTLTQIHDRASEEGYRLAKETMNEELALQYTKGYQAGFLEAKKLHGETEGEWLDNVFIGGYVCNNCNAGYSSNPKSAFCPICGVKMKNGQVPEVLARRKQSETNGGQADE